MPTHSTGELRPERAQVSRRPAQAVRANQITSWIASRPVGGCVWVKSPRLIPAPFGRCLNVCRFSAGFISPGPLANLASNDDQKCLQLSLAGAGGRLLA